MAQPHRMGHKFGNKAMRRRVERKQRQAEKRQLAGTGKRARKKKPKKAVKTAKPVPAYLCGPKQMTLGEVVTG